MRIGEVEKLARRVLRKNFAEELWRRNRLKGKQNEKCEDIEARFANHWFCRVSVVLHLFNTKIKEIVYVFSR